MSPPCRGDSTTGLLGESGRCGWDEGGIASEDEMLTGGGLRGREGVEDERDSVEAFESGCANNVEVGERRFCRGCPCGVEKGGQA